jgi:hypothetical protein
VLFSDVRASFQWAGETINRKAAPEKTTAFWEEQSIISFMSEPVSKCSILFEIKEGENFNHRNTCSILRIKI